MGLLDWVTDKAKAQYAKGKPYRQAVGGLLQGDMNKVNESLAQSDLTPMDFAMMLGSISSVGKGLPILNTLNPTGANSRSGLSAEYTPNIRATQPLGENIVTINRTMGGSPDDIITIYRGAPKNQKKIVEGDFITDMPELARAYTGDGNVLSMQVRRGDVLDDITEPLGNEYIYRPNADKLISELLKKKK